MEIFASVVINASIVHIFGWIIPEPFAIPPIVTSVSPAINVTATSFFFVSVVMIAFAASVPLARSAFFPLASSVIPALILSIGICIPITPVEPTRTPFSSIPRTFPASLAVSSQYFIPSSPVHAFAIPEFTITACDFCLLSAICLSHFTGAAFTTFVVNVPATLHGFSL